MLFLNETIHYIALIFAFWGTSQHIKNGCTKLLR